MDILINDFSPGLFIVQTILLLGLIFLLVKFAWKPILTSLNEREEGIQGALEAAEQARKEMQNLCSVIIIPSFAERYLSTELFNES